MRHGVTNFNLPEFVLLPCLSPRSKPTFFSEHHAADVPDYSQYFEIRDFIHGLVDGRMQENGISAKQYATKVVGEVEKGTGGVVWAGKDASILRLLSWLLPQSVFVRLELSLILNRYLIANVGYGSAERHSDCS